MSTTRRTAMTALAASLVAPAALAQGMKPGSPKGGADIGIPQIAGQYRSEGRQRDCTHYVGVAWVTQQWRAVEFTWIVGDKTVRGQGIVDGRLVTVDWGAGTPIVYAVMPNGALHGTFDDGLALERLSPL